MRRTLSTGHPVITFVSGSAAANERAKKLFCSLFSLKEVSTSNCPITKSDGTSSNSKLDYEVSDEMFKSFFSGLLPGPKTYSTAIQCPSSGTIVHFLSLESTSPLHTKSQESNDSRNQLSLISITESEANADEVERSSQSVMDSIRETRSFIASHFNALSPFKIGMYNLFALPINFASLLENQRSVPLVQTPPTYLKYEKNMNNTNFIDARLEENDLSKKPFLREIVIPFVERENVEEPMSLLSKLNSRYFQRAKDPITKKPVIGLFQWPKIQQDLHNRPSSDSSSNIYLRPLPAAKEDRFLPPPSLVFQCRDLEKMRKQISSIQNDVSFGKVGFSGASNEMGEKKGQLMVQHTDFLGLDIRLCQATNLSSSFAEAQDALLAGSLDDLQNRNVLSEGSDTISNTLDPMHNNGDCWVEFRASIKSPKGFLKSGQIPSTNLGKKKTQRMATAPNLPFE